MKSFWTWVTDFVIGLLISCYTAFIAQCYWNWFAVRALNVSSVSFLEMLGLVWLLQIMTSRPALSDNHRWKVLTSAVELCVPAEKQRELYELATRKTFDEVLQEFFEVFGQVGSNTLLLAAGFVLHLFV